jgi:hypothetical protein
MPDLSLMAFAFDLIVALWLPLPPIRRNLCITESALIISPSDGRRRSPKGEEGDPNRRRKLHEQGAPHIVRDLHDPRRGKSGKQTWEPLSID